MEGKVSSRNLQPSMKKQCSGDGRTRLFLPSVKQFTSLYSLASCISDKKKKSLKFQSTADFLECFRMYLDEKVVQK